MNSTQRDELRRHAMLALDGKAECRRCKCIKSQEHMIVVSFLAMPLFATCPDCLLYGGPIEVKREGGQISVKRCEDKRVVLASEIPSLDVVPATPKTLKKEEM
jgi:hypothetical protein